MKDRTLHRTQLYWNREQRRNSGTSIRFRRSGKNKFAQSTYCIGRPSVHQFRNIHPAHAEFLTHSRHFNTNRSKHTQVRSDTPHSLSVKDCVRKKITVSGDFRGFRSHGTPARPIASCQAAMPLHIGTVGGCGSSHRREGDERPEKKFSIPLVYGNTIAHRQR